MLLTERAIRAAKPLAKPYKLFDQQGLYLWIGANGSRWWRFKYYIDGREISKPWHLYPDVPLSLARERRDEARRLVAKGVDPSAQRRAEKAAGIDTFKAVGLEWLGKQQLRAQDAEEGGMDTQRFTLQAARLQGDWIY